MGLSREHNGGVNICPLERRLARAERTGDRNNRHWRVKWLGKWACRKISRPPWTTEIRLIYALLVCELEVLKGMS